MASRLHRLLRIIRLVRRPRYPGVEDLCQALDVKPRTIFNDLKELKELLGVDIRFDRSHGGYYLEGDEWQLTFWGLDPETALLLLTACQLVSFAAGEGFVLPLKEMFGDEIERCLKEQWSAPDTLEQIICTSIEKGNVDRKIFLELCRASATKRPVRLNLADAATLDVTPECLRFTPSGWQIVTRTNGDGQEGLLWLADVQGCLS